MRRYVLDAALRHSPVQSYFRRRAADRLTVLAYHGVDDPVRFESQLAWLARECSPVSLAEVATAAHGGSALPPRSVLVTFDDGLTSVRDDGIPLLRRYGIPAVMFVIPGLIDGDRPPWWTEVQALVRTGGHLRGEVPKRPLDTARWLKTVPDARRRAAIQELRETSSVPAGATPQLRRNDLRAIEASGVSIENHTWTHPVLDRCDIETVRHEIERAHYRLAEILGRPPRAFAYPNGNWDPRGEAVLARLGYHLGFLFDHRASPRTPAHPLRVSRVRVGSTTSLDRFAMIVSGLHPTLHQLRGHA